MTMLEVLEHGRALIAEPRHWVQNTGWMLKDDGGTAFCAMGALYAATGLYAEFITRGTVTRMGPSWNAYVAGVRALEMCLPTPEGVAKYNDTHTHAEVLATFDRAIAFAKGLKDEDPAVTFPAEWAEAKAAAERELVAA